MSFKIPEGGHVALNVKYDVLYYFLKVTMLNYGKFMYFYFKVVLTKTHLSIFSRDQLNFGL